MYDDDIEFHHSNEELMEIEAFIMSYIVGSNTFNNDISSSYDDLSSINEKLKKKE